MIAGDDSRVDGPHPSGPRRGIPAFGIEPLLPALAPLVPNRRVREQCANPLVVGWIRRDIAKSPEEQRVVHLTARQGIQDAVNQLVVALINPGQT